MTFFDWVGATAAGIQSIFAWAAFNRDAFADNVSWRQSQSYQKKNYHLGWIAVARDDIRDMMGISVNRINNYMIVATLILGVASSAVMSVSFSEDDPDFLVNAFFVSIGLSIVYLMMAIMFCVTGQNCAFTNTIKLLTYEVRPENPADYNHDYMKQAQWVEKNGLMQMFRIPGIMPKYKVEKECMSGTSATLEDSTPLETLESKSTHLWYLTKFGTFMGLWTTYDMFAKFAMGLGIISLGHGSAYFSLAKLLNEQRRLTAFSAFAVTFSFIYLVVLVVLQNFKFKNTGIRWMVAAFLAGGPIAGTIGAVTGSATVLKVCVPLCYFFHAVFYLSAFFMAQNDFSDAKLAKGAHDVWDHYKQSHVFDARKKMKTEKLSAACAKATTDEELDEDADEEEYEGDRENRFYKQSVREEEGGRTISKVNGMPTDGDDITWPTEKPEFKEKVSSTAAEIRLAVRVTLLVSAILWGVMLVWAISKHLVLGSETHRDGRLGLASLMQAKGSVHEAVVQRDIDVLNSLGRPFHPHALACVDRQVFLADRFHIFSFTTTMDNVPSVLTQVPCETNEDVIDVTAVCDDNGVCSPIALTRGAAIGSRSNLVNCKTGSTLLSFDSVAADHVHLLRTRANTSGINDHEVAAILVGHGGDVDQYEVEDGKWEAQWPLGRLGKNTSSLGSAGHHIMLFHSDSIELRDGDSSKPLGMWALPSGVSQVTSGCFRHPNGNGSSSALLLHKPVSPFGEVVKPRLTEIAMVGVPSVAEPRMVQLDSEVHRHPPASASTDGVSEQKRHNDQKHVQKRFQLKGSRHAVSTNSLLQAGLAHRREFLPEEDAVFHEDTFSDDEL